jgi:hypothetical protein
VAAMNLPQLVAFASEELPAVAAVSHRQLPLFAEICRSRDSV